MHAPPNPGGSWPAPGPNPLGPPPPPSGGFTLRHAGFGCGAIGLLMLLGGALVFILLVTRTLKHMFHIRMKTADFLGVASLTSMGLGVLILLVAVVFVIVGGSKKS